MNIDLGEHILKKLCDAPLQNMSLDETTLSELTAFIELKSQILIISNETGTAHIANSSREDQRFVF